MVKPIIRHIPPPSAQPRRMTYKIDVELSDGMIIHVNLGKTHGRPKEVAGALDAAINKAVDKYNELIKDEE